MKILEINKFNYVAGGAERHFLDMIKLLESNGHQVAIFSMENNQSTPTPWSKYFVSYVGFRKADSILNKIKGTFRMFYSFEAKRKIRKLLDEFQPDAVHIHNIYHHISPSILKEIKKKNIHVIMTIHDYEFISPDREGYDESIGNQYWKFIFSKKYSFLQRLILVVKKYFHTFFDYQQYIDKFISPSEFTKDKFIKAGIAAEKIVVLPHFIIPSKKPTVSSKENYALYFGRIYVEKGVNDLAEMFTDISGMKLYVAGSIEDNFSLLKNSRVNYLGKLGREKLAEYIAGAKCVVSASTLQETFGLVALEAIQQGTPFVGLNSGAYPEVIEEGKSGFICQDLKEMKQILIKISEDQIEFNRELIAKIAEEKYNAEKYYSKITNIFKQ